MNVQLSPLVIVLACCFAITPSGQAYADDTKTSGTESAEKVRWAPIFSPKEIALVPSCEEKSVDCELPNKKDYTRFGYNQITVFDGDGSSYVVTYPERIGDFVTNNIDGEVSVRFEYHDSSDPQQDEIGDVQVCHCKK